ISNCGLESAITVTQQYRDVAVVIIRYGQVGLAVTIEVAYCHGSGFRPLARAVVDGGLEGAVAFVEQHRHSGRGIVGDGQVGLAVVVEIAECYGMRIRSDTVIHSRLKSPVAVAQQHRDPTRVGNSDVRFAV